MKYTIYVLETSSIDSGIRLIKIGITNQFENRMAAYHSANPLTKLLFRIDGIENPDVEKYLHKMFSKYLYKCDRFYLSNEERVCCLKEWFNFNNEIIAFFKEHESDVSFFNNLVTGTFDCELDSDLLPRKIDCINILMNSILDLIENKNPSISNLININNEVKEFFEKEVYISSVSRRLINLVNSESLISFNINPEDLFDKFKMNLTQFKKYETMFLKKLGECTISTKNMLLKKSTTALYFINSGYNFEDIQLFLDWSIRIYYNMCGKDMNSILKFGPDKNKILNNISNIKASDSKKEKIYSSFTVGETYLRSFIKDKLIEIYDECGISGIIPTCSELNNYFSLVKTKLYNSASGKREHALKILSRK